MNDYSAFESALDNLIGDSEKTNVLDQDLSELDKELVAKLAKDNTSHIVSILEEDSENSEDLIDKKLKKILKKVDKINSTLVIQCCIEAAMLLTMIVYIILSAV